MVTQIESWFRRFRTKSRERRLRLHLNPDMASYIHESASSLIRKIQWQHLVRIKMVVDAKLNYDEFRIYSARTEKDITEEYVDLNSRLRNAEATEGQYLTLLARAEEVEDILQIYEALSRIRYEIEQIKGRLQYLEQISAMSLISINLEPAISLGPLVPPGWSANETLNSAIRGLTSFGQGLGTAFIWIGIFSPIWGTAIGVSYWRRRHKRKA